MHFILGANTVASNAGINIEKKLVVDGNGNLLQVDANLNAQGGARGAKLLARVIRGPSRKLMRPPSGEMAKVKLFRPLSVSLSSLL